MTMWSLALAGLRHYRGVNAMVVFGVAVAVTVMAGALTVGASVRASLRELALARLGATGVVVASPTFFREELARELGGPPVIAVAGALTHADSGRTAARVQVFGIDATFLRFHGLDPVPPGSREAWISEGLAAELDAAGGDAIILRLAKPSDIPLDTLQGRRDEAGERLRLSVARVVGRPALGEFSLSPSQAPSLTMFVPLERLQADLDLGERVNTILLKDAAASDVALRSQAALDDYGLRLRTSPDERHIVVESRAGVMSAALADAVQKVAAAAGTAPKPVLVHLANTIRIRDRELPYSVVAGRAQPDGIVLNEWAAADLEARGGDIVEMDYYVWSDAEGLQTRSATFRYSGVVPMTGEGGDPTFTPDYPGLTDADDVSAWDPPFPVDLRRVRPADEEYWDRWRASPKAFVPIATAQQLWGTSHGSISSVRVAVPEATSAGDAISRLERELRLHLDPLQAGFQIRDARGEALAAAEGTTDFGEYFFYFSFFLVVSGLLLAALFFALGIEQRAREIGLLGAVGFSARDMARVLGLEAAVLAIMGSVIGVAGAVGYAAIIIHGLRTWWHDAVGTTDLTLHLDPALLAAGALAALGVAAFALGVSLRAALRRTPRSLLGGARDSDRSPAYGRGPIRLWIAIAATAIAIALLALASAGIVPQVAGFFGAGGALMIAGLALFGWWLRRPTMRGTHASVARFGSEYARWRPTRSVLSAALITFACFVIVSVGAFRRDPAGMSLDRSEGTGGFALMAESVAPLLHNPNTPGGRAELGLDNDTLAGVHISRFRLKPGDEASCLTLYQPTDPRIVAPEPAFLVEPRFRFASSMASSPEEVANPWRLLERRFADGAVPAIADQTSLTYVFHRKIGDDFVFTPQGGREIRLRIVGALADSVLQSELVIGEWAFVELFPRREGYNVWLIDTGAADAPAVATVLEDRLADFGMDVTDTRARLQSYHRVENTYLSTFQALGALGLLIGTFGIAAVLARNVLERRRELGLLRAVGFTPHHLRLLVVAESLLLVGAGLLLGASTAAIAVLPAVVERAGAVPLSGLGLLLTTVTIAAVISSILAARLATAASVVSALKSE